MFQNCSGPWRPGAHLACIGCLSCAVQDMRQEMMRAEIADEMMEEGRCTVLLQLQSLAIR